MGYISSVAAINPSPRGASADKELPPEFKHPPNRFKKPAQIESPPHSLSAGFFVPSQCIAPRRRMIDRGI